MVSTKANLTILEFGTETSLSFVEIVQQSQRVIPGYD